MKKQSKEILSKKTATALKAELSKYSDIFNVKETQELVQEVVSSVTEKTLTDWINTNMDSVVKKSVKEELAKIAKIGHTGTGTTSGDKTPVYNTSKDLVELISSISISPPPLFFILGFIFLKRSCLI